MRLLLFMAVFACPRVGVARRYADKIRRAGERHHESNSERAINTIVGPMSLVLSKGEPAASSTGYVALLEDPALGVSGAPYEGGWDNEVQAASESATSSTAGSSNLPEVAVAH